MWTPNWRSDSAVVGGEDQPDDPDLLTRAERAAEACPEHAITVVT